MKRKNRMQIAAPSLQGFVDAVKRIPETVRAITASNDGSFDPPVEYQVCPICGTVAAQSSEVCSSCSNDSI